MLFDMIAFLVVSPPILPPILLLPQAVNPVSCAVNFLYVCPFLHRRLPFGQILKTLYFVGRFCCFKIYFFQEFVAGMGILKVLSMIM